MVSATTSRSLKFWAIAISAGLTMLLGNLAAIVQTNVKRMLAYSSIAHAGYILVAFAASTAVGVAAVIFYLAAYVLMKVGAFLVVTQLGQRGERRLSIRAPRRPGNVKQPVLAAVLLAVPVLAYWACRLPQVSSEEFFAFHRPRLSRTLSGWWSLPLSTASAKGIRHMRCRSPGRCGMNNSASATSSVARRGLSTKCDVQKKFCRSPCLPKSNGAPGTSNNQDIDQPLDRREHISCAASRFGSCALEC